MKYFFTVILLSCVLWSQAQNIVTGRVIDADTKEGVPFCNVYHPGTTFGVATDIDGYYEFNARESEDSLMASAIGYQSVKQLIGGRNKIDFYMTSQSLSLDEVVVIAGENPANRIIRGIIDNKEQNRLKRRINFERENYSKIELDLDNINKDYKKFKLLKPFSFVFENIDSTSDEKPFLPFYVTESIDNQYYEKEEDKLKTIPLAKKVSGINNQTVVEFINSMYSDFKLYDNYFEILGKSFSAPFSNRAMFNYEYYLLDSTDINDQKAYKLKFKPKRRSEKTFYGEFWVLDSTFAVQRVDMRMSDDVNINLVSRLIFYQENMQIGSDWVPKRRKVVVDFSAREDAPGLIGRRTDSYDKYKINPDEESEEYKKPVDRIDISKLKKDDDFWREARHEELSKTEEQIYSMVDSIKSMPIYKTYSDVIKLIVSGYIDVGKVELGSVFSFFSYNEIEGVRPAFGLRTTSSFSKKIRLSGRLSYGFRDERFKPTIGVLWVPSKYPRRSFELRYKEAIDFSSSSSEDVVEGNLFSNVYRRSIYQKLLYVKEFKAAYEEFWGKGFSSRLSFIYRDLDPYGNLDAEGNGFNYRFFSDPERENVFDTVIVASEINFKLRYAFDEKFIDGNFRRTSLGSRYPILELQITQGLRDVFDSQYDYQKLVFAASHWFNVSTIGWFKYKVKAGKVFGTVPFLLAEVHEGNETYFYSPNAYNGMNKFAFASDQFVSIHLQHHFEGFFLNRIPLLRRLQLREVVEFRSVWGSMSDENLRANSYQLLDPTKDFENTYNGFQVLKDIPYMEVGFGIENILKVLRFDVIYRINYLEYPQASRVNIRAGFQFYL